jgi:hypothetical protein
MATLVLAAAGTAFGGAFGGTALGLTGAVIGRAVGGTLGSVIDQKLFGSGAKPVEVGKTDRFRVMGGGEGQPLARVYGRMRLSGSVIWASRFLESSQTSGGGKGAPAQPETRTYSYTVSLAIALCEGPITRVGRVWADGKPLDQSTVSMTVHRGTQGQMPDPVISAIEGAEVTPAYRGVAYVVFENLDLTPFGNRVPQFSFEVHARPRATADGLPPLTEQIAAVALVPGTGEHALATEIVTETRGKGDTRRLNVNNGEGRPDVLVALDQLETELPQAGAVSLVVSWFGDDLRCGSCSLRPKVENAGAELGSVPWLVSGLDRASAQAVGRVDGRPGFGGTPNDASVIRAIGELNRRGKAVMFYPFILMDIRPGNGRPDPWTGGAGQPEAPWRGRITASLAPGQPGSPDQTAAVNAEVAQFFGSASANDFAPSGETVSYTGPAEWSYRRFILHYARLCAMAGGVDAFCIGSEMRGLMQLRSGPGQFPAVAALRSLAAEVRVILGPSTRIGYAADWSEYFGYHPQDGSGDVWYHLDPLWADPVIDFVGIDNYMPLSDWRQGTGHADASWGSTYDPGYLMGNVEAGEGFDWYYASPTDRAAQVRLPITDGAYNEPWVFRYKDIRNWWSRTHHNRVGGVRQATPTAWVPGLKPVWFTELGCPAVDMGANQPNVFVDPQSSEGALPYFSNGRRDDFIQHRFLQAVHGYWAEESRNPVSAVYGGPMLDMARIFVWAWDARPWPDFPGRSKVWSDAGNHAFGHWISGRMSSVPLADVVADVCARSGQTDADAAGLNGLVRGYAVGGVETARQTLQPLMTTYGFDGMDRGDRLGFRMRSARLDRALDAAALAADEKGEGALSLVREPAADDPARIRLAYTRDDGEYRTAVAIAAADHVGGPSADDTAVPLVLGTGEARAVAERWYHEMRTARDSMKLRLPPSQIDLEVGDVVSLGTGSAYRIDRLESGVFRDADSRRIEAWGADAGQIETDIFILSEPDAASRMHVEFLDLPLMNSDAEPAPLVAATAASWPGAAAIYGSSEDHGYRLVGMAERWAVAGTTISDLAPAGSGMWQRDSVTLRLVRGALQSRSEADVLNGANVGLLRVAGSTEWEVFQFQQAELIGLLEYRLSTLLRGQAGTEAAASLPLAAGADFVLYDSALTGLPEFAGQRGLERHFRVGDSRRPYTDERYIHRTFRFDGIGLRPYSPVHVRHVRASDGTVSVSWVRRTRVFGDDWLADEVPLGEASERYRVRIVKGGTALAMYDTVIPGFDYAASMQVADGASGTFDIEVAQVSERFGPGPFTRITING